MLWVAVMRSPQRLAACWSNGKARSQGEQQAGREQLNDPGCVFVAQKTRSQIYFPLGWYRAYCII
ncbi:uncharacterized protein L969DRAFT_96547 [Mixia osmundae IAM 14324]|uniref:Uncharacterized protein n=1 Tax=Mixia osmundae (strain CBS 9802 / IAM 14324 / JCM 22182 / KY 12970) TaxID=764103 RepID=G7DUQ5_MIXOS|nr:uncharacterized protein L969DRAFT_96547 [Mixia osmundae IAM 14324]KEI37470.1 hypothetical protein L969DRAFT_96547 [Mixia osmundae IAM 14324]GAA94315.1 hypothetical protein E5Q_00964 [Mixia osmundae IAM 14324]